jgi:hypothetical protein
VNVKEAEAVLALSLEINHALVIAATPIDDIYGRFAAERATERIFQGGYSPITRRPSLRISAGGSSSG